MLTLMLSLALQAQDVETPAQVFERRILPIFKSPGPSSCLDCHLSGVDLKNYIHPSHEKTFLSLRDQGLIDLAKPEASRILKLIGMGESAGAALIREKVRRAELEAFTAWIRACAADPKLRDAPKLPPAELARPKRPDPVIRHNRADRVLAAFERQVWSQRFRCSPCHAPDGAENAKLVKENGEGLTWIRPEGPEATMKALLAANLVSPKAPEKSLLLLKPLNAVKHGGGQKMLVGDLTYKAFRAWIDDYAKVVNDQYAQASELPPAPKGPATYGSDVWLKLVNTPPAWGDKLLQVALYPRDPSKNAWASEPCAVSDRLVFGKGRLWQHNLTLLDTPRLAPGKYLLRVHVDAQGRLQRDWRATLGKGDLVAELELDSRWPAGYGSMTVVDVARLK